jgi:hypothetical protein
MSPLRRWMTEHGRPSWYSWVVVVMVPILVSTGVLIVALRVNQRSIERERAERLAAERAFCGIVVLLDDSYRRSPPSTPAGKDLAREVAEARIAYRCD